MASEGEGWMAKCQHGVALELGCLRVLGGALCLKHLGFWFWVSFECDGSKSASPPAGQGWFHPKPARHGPNPHPGSGSWGEHRAPAGSQVWVGQMGVQDHLPSCPHSHEKTFDSCQLVLKHTSSASSVPQFPLSHPRLVPRILTAPPSTVGSSSDPGGGSGPFAHGVLPGRQRQCRNVGLGGPGTLGQAVPAAGARGAVRPLSTGTG